MTSSKKKSKKSGGKQITQAQAIIIAALITATIGGWFTFKSSIMPIEIQISATKTEKAKLESSLTQTSNDYNKAIAENPDLNPNLLTFPIISMVDTGTKYGWTVLDAAYQDRWFFQSAVNVERFWSYNSTVEDPPFDITILNTMDTPIFITDIGIEVMSVSYLYGGGGGGGSPYSGEVTIQNEYKLNLPDINSAHTFVNREGETQQAEYEKLSIDKIYSFKLSNPIYVQSQAPYRYVLTLQDYIIKMPTHVFLRLWVKTDKGEARSRIIYLYTHRYGHIAKKY